MARRIIITLLQTLLISAVLFSGYYLFYLKPRIQLAKNRSEMVKILTIHKNTLTQNRIAYVNLTKLDSNSASFQIESSNIINTLKTSEKEGLKQLALEYSVPETFMLKNEDFIDLIKRTQDLYQKQEEIVKEIQSTKSYKDGLLILKSQDSIELLTNETNIILEYQYLIEKLSNF